MSNLKMWFLSESRCKENVEGRGCDTCRAGAWEYPTCDECDCEVKGTTEEICNQETAECFCKPTVEGDRCDTCQLGYFDLQQINPEGCSQCFCSGKTSICNSHDRLNRTQIEFMENWGLTSFKVAKTIVEKKPSGEEQSLPNYSGELAVQFNSYPDIDLNTNTLYFKVS